MTLLEQNWDKIKDRVILPLWHGRFKSMYNSAKLDYDDFESLAGLELSKAMEAFDPEKSNIFTYATRVISQKACTELRDCTRRDKRKMLHMAESYDAPDSQAYKVAAKEKQDTSELSELRVGGFIKSLSNNQLRVLILSLLNFDADVIPYMLNLSKHTMNEIVKSLQSEDVARILYRRRF